MSRSRLRSRTGTAFRAFLREPLQRRRARMVERSAPQLAERLYALADSLCRLPFAHERAPLPSTVQVAGHPVNVLDDLAAYTGLPADLVHKLLTQREPLSFRAEWWATSAAMREDHWYYLASKGYLFANATHFPDPSLVETLIVPHVEHGARILDFGGGTGNFALHLVARGYRPVVRELSSLQRDFLRFRIARHDLQDHLSVMDPWEGVPAEPFAAIVAFDVLEHLPDPLRTLDELLLPALAPLGVLVENSPFEVNVANPMHHPDRGLDHHLQSAGFSVVGAAADGSRVWRR